MGQIVDPSELILELGLSATITDEQRAIVTQSIPKAEAAVFRYLGYNPKQAIRTEYYPVRAMGNRGAKGVWEVDATSAFIRQESAVTGDELQVRHLPIRATDSDAANAIDLRIDHDGRFGTQSGSFAVSQQETEGTGFWPAYDTEDSGGIRICNSGIIRSHGRWPSNPGSIKIVYVGGYTAGELRGTDGTIDAVPIWSAVVDEVRRRVLKVFSQRRHTGAGFAGPFVSEGLGDYSYRVDATVLRQLLGGSWDLMMETRQSLDSYVNYGWQIAS